MSFWTDSGEQLLVTANNEYDGKFFPVADAIEGVIGTEGAILIFGGADVVGYEGEALSRRYISIK